MSDRLDPAEALVADIVCDWLGGVQNTLNDDGSADLAHDYDIELADGHVVALEVTRWTSSERRRLESALEKAATAVPSLRRHWSLALDGYGRRVDRIMESAPVLLAKLEELGIERFPLSADYDRPDYLDTIRALRLLGIPDGRSVERKEGWIALVPAVVEQTTMLAFLEEAQAIVDANAVKLRASDREICVLAVYVDMYLWSGHAPMGHGFPPPAPLSTPDGTDLVLLLRGGWITSRAVDRVWSFTERADLVWCGTGWTDVTAEF